MFRSYIRSAVRALRHSRGTSFLNIAGLSVGLASCFLIVSFINHELRFDTQHPDVENLYRLVNEDSIGTMLNRSAIALGRGTTTIPDLIPAVSKVTRVHRSASWLVRDDRMIRSTDFAWTDGHVFETFDIPLEVGDPATALVNPNTVVITRDLARRLFGNEDPIGAFLEVEGVGELTVTGLLAEPAHPSHITYEALASFATLASIESPWDSKLQGWSYLTLAPGSDPAQVEGLLNEHMAEIIPWLNFERMARTLSLQAVKDIRLYSADMAGAGNVSDIDRVTLFSVVVLLILLLACANFANLSTVRSLRRAREVGVRKTVGAGRSQLVIQFLLESVAVAVLAFVVALLLVAVARPWFADMLVVDLPVAFLFSPAALGSFLIITLAAGVLAGCYPAMYLSRFQAALVVKGGTPSGKAGTVRNVLVVGQFAIAAALIFASTVVVSQLGYLADRDLGYEEEDIVLLSTAGLGGAVATLQDRIRTIPGVEAVSHASGSPVNGGFMSEEDFNGERLPVHRLLVDTSYPEAMGLGLVEGRFWDLDREGEGDRAAIVNQAYADAKGWVDPLNEVMVVGRNEDDSPQTIPVIGVVADFNVGSARNPVEPLVLDASSRFDFFKRTLIVRMSPSSRSAVMAGLEEAWKEVMPHRPFNPTWLVDSLANLRADDERMSRLLNAFTLLALLVSNLGMIGLAALAISLRRKEIGVRKVLGANQTGLVYRLSRDFLVLVGLACLLAIPVTWFGVEYWLQEFAFRIDLGASHVVTALLLVGLPSVAVIVMQAMRSSRLDPVRCLRTE